jgi:hypothetical protein
MQHRYILWKILSRRAAAIAVQIPYISAAPYKFISDYSTLEADAASFNNCLQSNSPKPRDRKDYAVITVQAF